MLVGVYCCKNFFEKMAQVICISDSECGERLGRISVSSLLSSGLNDGSDVEIVSTPEPGTTSVEEHLSESNSSIPRSLSTTPSKICFPETFEQHEAAASLLFSMNEKTGKYRISRNIEASDVDIAPAPPTYYPTSPDGFATFVNLDAYDIKSVQEFVEGSPYSVRGRSEKKSSVILCNGSKYSVWRKTVRCSGIKCCLSSFEKCSTPHWGPWKAEQEHVVDEDTAGHTDWEYEKAVQVFFCGQNSFPLVCKHVRNKEMVTQLEVLTQAENQQKRIPNWIFKQGKKISFPRASQYGMKAKRSSKLRDYFGCADFGKPGVTNHKNCDLVPLPAHLQDANPELIEEIAARARQGIFPVSKSSKGDCPPLRVTYTGKHCPRSVHLQGACDVRRIECDVEYHYLFHQLQDGSFSWVIVVGIGVHKHSWPLARAPPSLVKSFVTSMHSSNPTLTSRQIAKNVEEYFGLKAPMNTIQKIRYRLNCEMYPFGKSIQALIAAYKATFGEGERMYINKIVDERMEDESRLVRDQVSVSIILCNRRLLRLRAKFPRLRCDGTFRVFCSYDDGLDFELNSIIAKDPKTGKIFSPMRQLASRKTTAARKILFKELVAGLVEYGMEDPCVAPISKRLSMATDFETTYAVALGQVLAEQFRSETYLTYVQTACIGCDVHAKRVILEKCNVSEESDVYNWAIGTRQVTTRAEVDESLNVMKGIGGKWNSFADWLEKNKVAFILWFFRFNTKIPVEMLSDTIFWDTNGCEAGHSRIKGLHEYLLSNRKGLPLVQAVSHLEKMDREDAENIEKTSPIHGIQYCSVPQWKRTQAKGRKRVYDDVIIVGEKKVSASQPKKAKKSSSVKGKSPYSQSQTEKQIDVLTRATKDLQAQNKEIHFMLAKLLEKQ